MTSAAFWGSVDDYIVSCEMRAVCHRQGKSKSDPVTQSQPSPLTFCQAISRSLPLCVVGHVGSYEAAGSLAGQQHALALSAAGALWWSLGGL